MTRHLPLIFWWQSLRDFRRRPLMVALNILSIALGVAVYLAIQIANASANKAFEAAVDVVAGRAHVEIRGNVDEKLWPEIARQPSVKAITATVEGVVTLPDYPGEYVRIFGVDAFSSAPFLTFELSRDRASFDFERWLGEPGIALNEALASKLGLKVGDTVRALANGRIEPLWVTSILDTTDAPAGADSTITAMDIGWAQELFDSPGRLTSLLLLLNDPNQAADAIKELNAILPDDLEAVPPRQRSTQLQRMVSAFQLNLTALSMVSLLVGVFLVYNTVSATVIRRRRDIGILRAIGASRNEVRTLFLGEAFVFGTLGIALGCLSGVAVAPLLSSAVEQTISSLYVLVHIGEVAASPIQFFTAAIFGVAAVLGGAWLPASEAAKVDPVRALALGEHAEQWESHSGRFGWGVLGCAALSGLLGIAALRPDFSWLAFVSAFLLLVAWALLAPGAVLVFSTAARKLGGTAILWTLAAIRFARAVRRNAVTIAALSAAVAMTIALTVMIYSFRRTVSDWIDSVVVADVLIAPSSNEIVGLGATVLPAAVEWLRHMPEVSSVDTFWEERMRVGVAGGPARSAWVTVHQGPFRKNLPFRSGDPAQAAPAWERGEALLVSEPFSKKWGVRVGDQLNLESAAGAVVVPIAGVYADYGHDEGVILLNRTLFDRHWPGRGAHSLAVYLREGDPAEDVMEQFRRKWSSAGEYRIYSNRQLRERVLVIFEQTFAVTALLRIIAVAVAVIGIFLSVSTLVLERERETGTLRAIGASRAQILILTTLEALFMGIVASILGVASGCTLAVLLTQVVNPAFFGWTIQLHWPFAALAATPLWIVVVAIAAALLPARRAASRNIAESVREE